MECENSGRILLGEIIPYTVALLGLNAIFHRVLGGISAMIVYFKHKFIHKMINLRSKLYFIKYEMSEI